MASSKLTPQVIHSRGDWFLQVRLPEFAVRWRDQNLHFHNLEIVGRQMHCLEHDDPALTGIINQKNAEGDYKLPCLELKTHWPALFASGPEFHYFDHISADYAEPRLTAGGIGLSGNSVIYRAYKHVAATMTYYLAQARKEAFAKSVGGKPTPLTAIDIEQAQGMLSLNPQLSQAKFVPTTEFHSLLFSPQVQLPRFYFAIVRPELSPAAFKNLVCDWLIGDNWWEQELESNSSELSL